MIILTTLLTGLPILIGLILWSKLPDSMATHWDVNGQANGWSSKASTVFFLPCILMIIHLFAVVLTICQSSAKIIRSASNCLGHYVVRKIGTEHTG